MAECPEVLGLKVLYEGPQPCVDIVAVHGLGASPEWAWIRKVEDGNEEVHVNWLADPNMLPSKLPQSRIMTFNYESKWLLGAPKQRCSLCAIQLLTALDNQRKGENVTKYRPLIFIGHSFGGVVIEQGLVSANSDGDNFQYLALSTVGVAFLGTPHRGTGAAKWGQIVATTAKALGLGFEDCILQDLREDSAHSRDLLYEFSLWANRARLTLICIFEQHKTDYGKRIGMTWKELVVDENSACIDGHRKVPLPTDHLKINKYRGPDDPCYIAVSSSIFDMVQNANRIIQGRLNPQTVVEDNSRIPDENLECLQSLYLSYPQDDLAAIRSAKGDRVPGTCEWILTQDRYTTWLVQDGPRLLWLSGGPGIGKTMISTLLVEELVHLAERSSQMTLAYYFCDDKNEKRRTATAILRGLLLQLLRQRPVLFKLIQPHFDMSRDSLCTNFHALWRIFVSIVRDPEAGEVYCLIDALDECEKESRQMFLMNLARLFGPQESMASSVKFIVTSRRESDIEEELLSADNSRIQDIQIDKGKVSLDLSKFIDCRVDQLSTVRGYKSAQTEKIRRALTEKAGGTFLYISLVLHDLKRAKIFLQVTQKLEELPSDLNKVYDRILRLIDADCEETAKFVLRWVAVARRPLTVDELAMALALGMGRWKKNTLPPEDFLDELRDSFQSCEPLVYFDTDKNTINLVHQSAKDYLLSTYLQENHDLSRYHIMLDETHLLLFKTCWTYMSRDEFEQGTAIIQRDEHDDLQDLSWTRRDQCFLTYAVLEGPMHAAAAGQSLAMDKEFWTEHLKRLPTVRDFWLLTAVENRQVLVLQRLLEGDARADDKDWVGRTILSRQAGYGHEATVRVLSSRDNVASDSQDRNGRTPLSHAAGNGHNAVVRLLLSQHDVIADSRDCKGQTPLSHAAENGHEAIVILLLSRHVIADSRDCKGQTPLSHAAENGHKAVVRLLLSYDGRTADAQDNGRRTPLSYAAANGHEAVVRLLLGRDDVIAKSRDCNGHTPLFYAARFYNVGDRHEAALELLLSREEVEENLPKWLIYGTLYAAVRRNHESVLRLLLNRDNLVLDPRDEEGYKLLYRAAAHGNEAIVRLLLSRDDVKVNLQDRLIHTMLVAAVKGDHESVVRLLLNRDGLVLDPRDEECYKLLSWAVRKRDRAIVKLLWSRGDIAVSSRDDWGDTPLDRAMMIRHHGVMRRLEQTMREISSRPRKSRSGEVLDGTETLDDENGSEDEETLNNDEVTHNDGVLSV